MYKGFIVVDIPETCGGCICCESNPVEDICTAADEITKFVNSPPDWCPIRPLYGVTGVYITSIDNRQYECAETITERGRIEVCQEIGQHLLKSGLVAFEEYDNAHEIVIKGTIRIVHPNEVIKGGASDETCKG